MIGRLASSKIEAMRKAGGTRGLRALRVLVLGLSVSASALACSGGEETTGPTTTGAGGTGATGATGGAGGTGGQATGGGGAGGVMAGGPAAADLVNAGQQSSSANYRLVFTFGQSTQNQGKTTSPNYRIQGGLIGAEGSLP